MLLKLDVNFADHMGNPVRKCTIIKCHKREGEAVDYGDDLFDVMVEEVLIPSSLASVWAEARSLNDRPSGIAELATKQLEGKEATEERRKTPKGNFAVPLISCRCVTAIERGVVHKVYSEEGSRLEMGDPLALLTTDPHEPADGTSALPTEAAPFRVITRPLDPDLVLERTSKSAEISRARGNREYRGKNFVAFWSEKGWESRIGIFMQGGCHLVLMFPCKALIKQALKGTCCIVHEGSAADSHTELLLQGLRDDLPQDCTQEVIRKLNLPPDYFRPRLFEPTFVVPGLNGPEEYPKNVVILDSGPDAVRTLYRHRQHGFLVDPGGGWLNGLNEGLEHILNDLSVVGWFRKHFVRVEQISVEKHLENLTRIVTLVKKNTGAHVLILNNVTVEPDSSLHSYQFVKNAQMMRRLELNLALVELSRKVDVFVLDADRILKNAGIRTGRDWDHFHPKINLLLAERAARIMRSVGVF